MTFVGVFCVKVSRNMAVIDKNVKINEGYRCKLIIGCKLNGGVNAVKVRSESMKVVNRMCPYHDVVYVTLPCVWLVREHVTKRLSNLARNRLT